MGSPARRHSLQAGLRGARGTGVHDLRRGAIVPVWTFGLDPRPGIGCQTFSPRSRTPRPGRELRPGRGVVRGRRRKLRPRSPPRRMRTCIPRVATGTLPHGEAFDAPRSDDPPGGLSRFGARLSGRDAGVHRPGPQDRRTPPPRPTRTTKLRAAEDPASGQASPGAGLGAGDRAEVHRPARGPSCRQGQHDQAVHGARQPEGGEGDCAAPTPSERGKGQRFFPRYIRHLPPTGEMVVRDRSWHNRAGVGRVMGYRAPGGCLGLLREVPELERMPVRSGITP